MAHRERLALLPGLLTDAALWRYQIDQLSGLADSWVADLTGMETVGEMAQSVLDVLPERFAVAGLSMGGYVALEIVRRAPQRVSRLALLDTRASPDSPETTQRRRGLIELAQKGKFKGVTPRLLPMLIHGDRLEDKVLTGTILAMAERIGRDSFLSQQKAIMSRPDFRGLLPGVACPTLVLCGRQDALTPLELHEEMAAAIPGAELVVVEGCGHLSALERPEAVTAAMRSWLAAA